MARSPSLAILLLVLGTVLVLDPTSGSGVTVQPEAHAQTSEKTAKLFKLIHNVVQLKPELFEEIKGLIDASLPTDNTTTDVPIPLPLRTVLSQIAGNPAVAKLLTVLVRPDVENVLGVLIHEFENQNSSWTNNDSTITDAILNQFHHVDVMAALKGILGMFDAKMVYSNDPKGFVRDQCYRDITAYMTNLLHGEKWALDMFDSTGKLTSGIQKGHLYFTGSYDQCIEIKATVNQEHKLGAWNDPPTRHFHTHFCRVEIGLPDSFVDNLHVDTHGVQLKLDWGVCVSKACSEADVKGLFSIGPLANLSLPIHAVHCHKSAVLSHDSSAIVAICILFIFGFLIVLGTGYDVLNAYNLLSNDTEYKTHPDQNNSVPNTIHTQEHTSTIGEAAGSCTQPVDGIVIKISDKTSEQKEVPPGYVHHREIIGEELKVESVNGIKQTTSNDRPSINVKKAKNKVFTLAGILLSFSLYTNLPKILRAKKTSGSIACIHGIRFLSLSWVVLGHSYNYGIISSEETLNSENILDFQKVIQRFTYQGVIAGGFAVDTFFVLSAFLLTWLKLKDTDKKKKKLTVADSIMYFFHRFWRLTPVYMVVLMFFACLSPYLGDGPLWPRTNSAAENCKTNWWTNLLYVNNLVRVDNQCMGWTWYLADDMQFYIISPIFLIAMYFWLPMGTCLTLLLLLAGIAASFWKEYIYNGNFFTMKADDGAYWKYVYIPPWARVGCWTIGMLLGLIVYRRERGPFRRKVLGILGWLLATGVALFIVYIPYSENKDGGTSWTKVERAFYEGIGRPLWGVCVAWVIFACYNNMGGVVNSLLSWNGFIPLSRLTYAVYLVHPICMMTYVYSRKSLLYVSDYNMIYLFLGHLVISYMVGFVVSLAFESPFMALEKVLFRTRQA